MNNIASGCVHKLTAFPNHMLVIQHLGEYFLSNSTCQMTGKYMATEHTAGLDKYQDPDH